MKGIKETMRKYGYYVTGPGKPKKPVKLKPISKNDLRYPEQVRFTTFSKIESNKKNKPATGVQHWGYLRRFSYDPTVPKAGDKVKLDDKGGKPKRKTFKPGPGQYAIGSIWALNATGKNQDI